MSTVRLSVLHVHRWEVHMVRVFLFLFREGSCLSHFTPKELENAGTYIHVAVRTVTELPLPDYCHPLLSGCQVWVQFCNRLPCLPLPLTGPFTCELSHPFPRNAWPTHVSSCLDSLPSSWWGFCLRSGRHSTNGLLMGVPLSWHPEIEWPSCHRGGIQFESWALSAYPVIVTWRHPGIETGQASPWRFSATYVESMSTFKITQPSGRRAATPECSRSVCSPPSSCCSPSQFLTVWWPPTTKLLFVASS